MVIDEMLAERRAGRALPRSEKGVARPGLRIDGRGEQTTTDGYPVAKVATVPDPALSQPLESNAPADRLRLMTIQQATDLWLGELERKSESPRTTATYRRLLDKLADAYPHVDVDELTATQLRRFLDTQSLKADRSRKADATVAQNVSIVNNFMDWLTREGALTRNPTRRNGDRILMRPKLAPPEENDNIVTVTSADVGKLLAAADASGQWNKRLAVHALVYLGPRRRAIAQARISDYDPEARTLAFTEKGAKTIRKPVPDRLADLIDAALAAGVYPEPDAYLVPGNGPQRRRGHRDDRVIWRLIREVATVAGVTTHVHALRAAFAVHFLEQKPGEVVALKDLMGHRRIETTLVYLRRRDRQRSMETVRDLDWAQIARKPLDALLGTEKEGFEPSIAANADEQRAGSHRAGDAPTIDAVLLEQARAATGSTSSFASSDEGPKREVPA